MMSPRSGRQCCTVSCAGVPKVRPRLVSPRVYGRRSVHPRNLVPTRPYHDDALQWAAKHREAAQACLEIPPLKQHDDYLVRQCATWSDYMRLRGWDHDKTLQRFGFRSDSERSRTRSFAQALVSHVLSAPLTLRYNLPWLSVEPQLAIGDITRERYYRRICCVGARAEATLPLEYWKEWLILERQHFAREQKTHKISSPSLVNSKLQLTIDFLGPDCIPRPSHVLSYEESTLTLQWLSNQTFHEYVAQIHGLYPEMLPSRSLSPVSLLPWDAYALFNPGLGHHHLKQSWQPTLQLLASELQQHSKPILCTAHSSLDAERDEKELRRVIVGGGHQPDGFLLEYQENAWASQISYQDPFDRNHVVHPNAFAARLYAAGDRD
jgi:hypothetical protein